MSPRRTEHFIDGEPLAPEQRRRYLFEDPAEWLTLEEDFVSATEVQPRKVQWFWRDRVVANKLNVLAGVQGTGKSQVALKLAAELSRGWLGPARPTLVLTAEDDPEDTVVPRFIEAEGRRDGLFILRTEATMSFPHDLQRLSDSIAGIGAGLVILDPVFSFVDDSTDSYKDHSVRGVLGLLRRLAQESETTILGLMHLKKGQESEAVFAVGGSVGWTAHPRSVLLLTNREPRDEFEDDRVLWHVKCNNGRKQPPLEVHVEGVERENYTTSFVTIEEEPNALLRIADHLGETRLGRPPEAVEEAQALLRELLPEDGTEVPSREVQDAMRANGISASTYKRARAALDLPRPRKTDDGWFMRWPR